MRLLALAAACCAWACAGPARPGQPAPPPVKRVGLERLALERPDPEATAKAALLRRINQDRRLEGLAPLRPEPRAALAGDLFCEERARSGGVGHWDAAGRAPYVRWGELGGLDYHVENTGFLSFSSGRLEGDVETLLLRLHATMMAETPPEDGHRRVILDPAFTHVGIGVGVAGGEFRMSEEFTRVGFEWLAVPDAPVAAGGTASFAGKPLRGWSVGVVEVRFEPPPRPLAAHDPRERSPYFYPPVAHTFWPRLGRGGLYAFGSPGDFDTARDGSVRLRFPLDRGPGSYLVVAYLREESRPASTLRAATAALVRALP